MPLLFSRIPQVFWVGLLAFFLTVVAGGVWTSLLISNLSTTPTLPWSAVVMGALLWLMWQYLGGRWGPQRTSEARRRSMRARRVSGPVWFWAVTAGMLAILSLSGVWIVLIQLGVQHARALQNLSAYPWYTIALVLVMTPLVSSLAEEVAFRGYFQGLLEDKVSALAAIVIAAVVIAPGHGLTQGFLVPTVVWYFFVDLMLGGMAYLTKSIVPGIIVHTLGLLIFFALVWPADPQRPLVLKTGADTWFWIHVAQTSLGALLAILAFWRLARLTRGKRAIESTPLFSASAVEPPG
jgi:membrane protease YdiL (CAAX protease family)